MPVAPPQSSDDRSSTQEEEEEEAAGDDEDESSHSHHQNQKGKKTGSKEKTVFKKIGKTLSGTKPRQTSGPKKEKKKILISKAGGGGGGRNRKKASSDSSDTGLSLSSNGERKATSLNRKAFAVAKAAIAKKKKERSVCSMLRQFLTVLEKVNW